MWFNLMVVLWLLPRTMLKEELFDDVVEPNRWVLRMELVERVRAQARRTYHFLYHEAEKPRWTYGLVRTTPLQWWQLRTSGKKAQLFLIEGTNGLWLGKNGVIYKAVDRFWGESYWVPVSLSLLTNRDFQQLHRGLEKLTPQPA